ncbi:MAG: hypothetical protein PHU44_15245 [Syntrophales bacterium]|nr:hypothetical protein [Syntrophales bacterium]
MEAKRRKHLLRASCLSLLLLMFWAAKGLGAAAYRYQDLGILQDSYFSWAGGINDRGQVVGYSGTKCADGNYEPHAVSTTAAGPMEDLGTLAGGQSIADGYLSGANGINNGGQAVGWSAAILADGTFAQHAFLWTAAGGLQDLGTLGGDTAGATAINASGQVVGWSSTILPGGALAQRAFLWTAGGDMQDLGTLGGDSWAYGLNSNGQVVGAAATVSPDGTLVEHAFVRTAGGGLQDLGTLGGGNSSAGAINDRGQIVGSADTAAGQPHAFLRTIAGAMLDLGTLGGGTSGANGINGSGQVVGWSTVIIPGGTQQHAFLWTAAEGLQDLNTLVINPPSGDFLLDARAINDTGKIVGSTNKGRAFLLTPINTMPPVMELLLLN